MVWSRKYRSLTDSEIDRCVDQSASLQKAVLKHNLNALRMAEEKGAASNENTSAHGDKFSFTIQGGSLDDFQGGVTDRVGEPRADIKTGIAKEHLESGDADIPFKTSNYGIVTTPRQEYLLVVSGGEGLKKGDTRVLNKLEYYEALQTAKEAGLTRPEITAVILYTGPMFVIYNGRLRGFGHCGEVETGKPPVSVEKRCKDADNSYTSTIHALVSAVKKLQKPGRGWLYRGLSGGQLPAAFCKTGFAEWAFMSTTKSLKVAVEYSGAKQGKTATVLRMQVSDVDGAASIAEFSQYPGMPRRGRCYHASIVMSCVHVCM